MQKSDLELRAQHQVRGILLEQYSRFRLSQSIRPTRRQPHARSRQLIHRSTRLRDIGMGSRNGRSEAGSPTRTPTPNSGGDPEEASYGDLGRQSQSPSRPQSTRTRPGKLLSSSASHSDGAPEESGRLLLPRSRRCRRISDTALLTPDRSQTTQQIAEGTTRLPVKGAPAPRQGRYHEESARAGERNTPERFH